MRMKSLWLSTACVLAVVFSLTYAQRQDRGCCITFAIDESTSLRDSEFNIIKDFVGDIIDSFTAYAQTDGQTAAVCKFSTDVTGVFPLTQFDNAAAAAGATRALIKEGGSTSTNLAINQLRIYLQACTPGYNKIGVVITDGNANDETLATQESVRFKTAGNTLFVIGIGTGLNIGVMRNWASDPDQTFYPVADFATLQAIRLQITEQLCSELRATTTPRPTQPPVITCSQCEFINGLYVYNSPQYCYVFQQCINWQSAIPFERICPLGQFFDMDVATCRPLGLINCDADPCFNSGITMYANHRTCRAYFTCQNGRTFEEICCPEGQGYSAGTGCVNDASCTTPCRDPPRIVYCVARAVPGDNTVYDEQLSENSWTRRQCPDGTSFFEDECECSRDGPIPPSSDCEHDLYIPFNRNVQDFENRRHVTNVASPLNTFADLRNNRVKVESINGATGGSTGTFNGENRLMVKQYDNYFFGNVFTFRTRFMETSRPTPVDLNESILGNGDCTDDETIDINYDRDTNAVNALIKTYDVNNNEVLTTLRVAPVSQGAWKDVELRYDGARVRLTVDGAVDEKDATGNIVQRKAALHIGNCCNDEFQFTGHIDEFYYYPCLPN